MKPRAVFLTVGALLSATVAGAASTAWQSNEHGRVRLITSYNVVPKAGEMFLGLHFQPKPGWYVYWKDPGEAGIPPRVNWAHTRGLSNLEILFPLPTKLILPGDITEYGYEGESVYPIRAVIRGGAIHIVAKLSYLTCNTSCVPYAYTFSLDVPQGDSPVVDQEAQGLIQTFLVRVPPKGMTDAEIKTKAPAERKNPGEPMPESSGSPTLFGMLLVAFLGGLILNVMPCVLPVLSIKLTGLLQHSGQSHTTVVKGALASAAGILVSFQGLAVAAVLARQAGHAIGWGIQFQNPVFVTFLMLVVLLFALNLWGVFEINMPRFVGHFATTYGYHETMTAHFMSGLFATLLATPCSAPFLGTAMGFALSQSNQTILVIFLAVGMGMALPYFLLAVFPQAIHWLPKPGHWMISLKKVLALFLLATAAWLGWVLYQQTRHETPRVENISAGLAWESFDEGSIQRYLRKGRPVFVDVTADWCVTCKYNERYVLSDSEVIAELTRQNVVMMKADWTNRDQSIASYLMKHGRAGIPFYAFYRPGRPPVLLSEFLTKAKVLRVLKQEDDSAVALKRSGDAFQSEAFSLLGVSFPRMHRVLFAKPKEIVSLGFLWRHWRNPDAPQEPSWKAMQRWAEFQRLRIVVRLFAFSPLEYLYSSIVDVRIPELARLTLGVWNANEFETVRVKRLLEMGGFKNGVILLSEFNEETGELERLPIPKLIRDRSYLIRLRKMENYRRTHDKSVERTLWFTVYNANYQERKLLHAFKRKMREEIFELTFAPFNQKAFFVQAANLAEAMKRYKELRSPLQRAA